LIGLFICIHGIISKIIGLTLKYLFIISFLALEISSCRDYYECPNYLVIHAKIEPLKLEYSIGDTITILSKFSKWVDGYNSEYKFIRQFNTEGVDWFPITLISRIDTIESPPSTLIEHFEFIEDGNYNYNVYTLSDNSSGLDGEYNYSNDTFELKIKLVTKETGTFGILQKSGTGSYGSQKFQGSCPGRSVYGWVDMNQGSDNNIYLLHESPDSTWNYWILNDSIQYFKNNGGFCFKVK